MKLEEMYDKTRGKIYGVLISNDEGQQVEIPINMCAVISVFLETAAKKQEPEDPKTLIF